MSKYIPACLVAALGLFVLVACRAAPTPTSLPPPEPTATSAPTSTATLRPTNTPIPTPTFTPTPPSKVNTGMKGDLTIRGTVRDSAGQVAPKVFVLLSVYGQAGGGDIGRFGQWTAYTDEMGAYAFEQMLKMEEGHYEVWFNGGQEYGKAYENSGYYVDANTIAGHSYVLDVTVYPVTGSALRAVIRYEDVDKSIKDFYADAFRRPETGHMAILRRGAPGKEQYSLGVEYSKIHGSTTEWSGLAGGTYTLSFIFRRLDGVLLECKSPAIEILPGQTKDWEYIIRGCPPVGKAILP